MRRSPAVAASRMRRQSRFGNRSVLRLENLEVRRLLSASSLTSDLVAHWTFDRDTLSAGIGADVSGGDHHAMLRNGPLATSGVTEGALQFDGVDDYADIGHDAAIVGTGSFSVAAWVRTTAASDQVIVQQRSPLAYNGEYVLKTTPSGQVHFWTFGDGQHGTNVVSSATLNDGRWRSVVAVREDDGTGKIYIDGRLDGQHAAPPRTMAAIDLAIGADTRGQSNYFAGAIDDVRIYNRALNPEQIEMMSMSTSNSSAAARRDFFAATAGTLLLVTAPGLLSNDVGENLSVATADQQSELGAIVNVQADGSFSYDSQGSSAIRALAGGQTLTDRFEYSIDRTANASATVAITVTGINDPPLAVSDNAIALADRPLTLRPLQNDSDVDSGDVLSLVDVDNSGGVGRVTLGDDNTIQYDPSGHFDDLAAGETANESFTYTVSDAQGATAIGQLAVTIRGVGANENSTVGFGTRADQVLVVRADGVLADELGSSSAPDSAVPSDLHPINLPGYYVSTEGSSSGDGSWNDPWSLAEVLANPPAAISPGDVIWVRGGVYRGRFVSNLSGTAASPIVVRAFPGEHVQLDLYNPAQWEQAFFVLGDHVTYQGFEVTSSSPGPRTTNQSGPFQTDVNRGGISVRGHYNKFINLVVHDLNAGIGYWGDGGEIHGSIIYNNGWDAPDRQHGHGFYLQNNNGLKSVSDNIVFNQFGAGIHAYGSGKAHLNNLSLEGNVSFNNGAGVGQGFMPERDILVGGIAPVRNATLHGNYTFQNELQGIVDVGYVWGPENKDVRITDNYFVASVRFLQAFDDVVVTGNTIVGSQRPVSLTTPDDGVIHDYTWDNNRYVHDGSVTFGLDNAVRSLADWKRVTGFDSQSVLPAADSQVFVRPNLYEPGRANVIVYNWDRQPTVNVDLSSVLKAGDRFELRSAIDYYGDSVMSGLYTGDPIVLPMTNRAAPSPTGYSEASPVGTDSRFGVFVVNKVRSSEQAGPLVVTTRTTRSQLGAKVTFTSDGGFTYDPTDVAQAKSLAAGETVSDHVTFQISDGRVTSERSAEIQLVGVNDRPDATDALVEVGEAGRAVTASLSASDIDHDDDAKSLSYQWLTSPNRGELVDLGAGKFRFDPAGEFADLSVGERVTQSLRYRVTDKHGAFDEATATIRVTGANSTPHAVDDSFEVASDSIFVAAAPSLLANDRDVDRQDTLAVADPGSRTSRLGANVMISADGGFRYDPTSSPRIQSLAAGAVIEDHISYRAVDPLGATSAAQVTLRITKTHDVTPQGPTSNDPSNSLAAISGAGRYVLKRNPDSAEFLLLRDGTVLLQAPVTSSAELLVSGAAGSNDSLTIEFSQGNPIPVGGLHWNGMDAAGIDSLMLDRGHFESLDIRFDDPSGSGQIDLVDSVSAVSAIRFQGLESLQSTVEVVDAVVALSGGDDHLTLQASGGHASLISGPSLVTKTKIDHPSGMLSLDGRDGNDTVEIRGSSYQLAGASLSIDAEQVGVHSLVRLAGGSFHSSGTNFVSATGRAIRTEGGDVILDHDGDVQIGGSVVTGGGRFESHGSGSLIMTHYLANIVSDDNNVGGDVSIKHAGDVTLNGVNTRGGSLTIDSGAVVWLRGRIDTRGESGGDFLSSGDQLRVERSAMIYTGGADVTLDHTAAIYLGSQIRTGGGTLTVAGGGSLETSVLAMLVSDGGAIHFEDVGDVVLGNSILTGGGDFRSMSENGNFHVARYTTSINTSGTLSDGSVWIEHADDVDVHGIATGGGAVELVSGGDIRLHGRVDTQGSGGGAFTSHGSDFTSEKYASIKTGGAEVHLVHRGNVLIGDLIDSGGGAVEVVGANLTSLHRGTTIRTRGGSATLDVRGTTNLAGDLDTSSGELHVKLYLAPFVGEPLLGITGSLDFPAGSTVTIDAGGGSMTEAFGPTSRIDRIIEASRIGQLSLDVNLVNIALGDEPFVASLVKDDHGGLDLLLESSG